MCEFSSFLVSPDFLKIFIPSVIAIVVAFYSHTSAVTRQINEHKLKQRIEHLSNSFRSLLMFSGNPNQEEGSKHLRDALISIQFLGTKWQVDQMQQLIDTLGTEGAVFSFDPLLASLRDELRENLDLEKIEGKVYWSHPTFHQQSESSSQK